MCRCITCVMWILIMTFINSLQVSWTVQYTKSLQTWHNVVTTSSRSVLCITGTGSIFSKRTLSLKSISINKIKRLRSDLCSYMFSKCSNGHIKSHSIATGVQQCFGFLTNIKNIPTFSMNGRLTVLTNSLPSANKPWWTFFST